MEIIPYSVKALKHVKPHVTRFIELDLLRSIAIISMIFLHVLWDLDYFGILGLNRGIYRFQFLVPMMFFTLAGICLMITTRKRHTMSEHEFIKHQLYRGGGIFGLGMVLTLVTLVVMPDRPIFFGVLHCIGLSIILSIPFLKFKSYNVVFALLIIIAGFFMALYPVSNPSIAHLMVGVHQADVSRYTIDYFPLFPWFGVILFGVAIGNVLYKDGNRQFAFPDLSRFKPVSAFSWLGKHSLAIYLIHQPLIVGLVEGYLYLSHIV